MAKNAKNTWRTPSQPVNGPYNSALHFRHARHCRVRNKTELAGTAGKGKQTMMLKLTLHYARYAFAMLATVGFGLKLN